jgi:two-component system phosphate regulon sensor histidine kinase PhoR
LVLDAAVRLGRANLKRIHQSLQTRTSSISQGLILSIAGIVIITVLLGALPTAGVILLQLKRQVELSVQNAQLTTYAFYNAERERLFTLISTFAERPTLCKLVNEPNPAELSAYLETLRDGTSIDALYLVSGDQQLMKVPALENVPDPITLRRNRTLPFTDLVALDDPQRLIVISADSIRDPINCPLETPAWLMAVQVLDDQDMRTLAQRSGLEQSLIMSGNRITTSLKSAPDWSLNPEAAEVVGQTLTSCCTSGASEAEKFYIGLAPLLDNQGNLVAISEVALPGNAIIRSARNAVLLLFLSSAVIALIAAYVGISLTRRITRPLNDLVDSAESMSQGDLEKPIPTESDWTEINQLATQLEKSRRYLRKMLQINQGETKRLMNMLTTIREGIVILDPNGRIAWLNPHAERVLNRQAAQVLHSHYSQVFIPANRETLTLQAVLEKPTDQSQTTHRLTVLDAQQRPHLLAVTVTPIKTGDNAELQQEREIVFHDLSEEAANNQLRSEFLTNMAHEFRTPLSSIAATIELLSDDASNMSSAEIAELTNTALMSTQHLQALVNNLLERFTIDAGVFRLRCQPILIENIIQKSVEIMTPLIQRRKQKLVLTIPEGLPTVWADPDRLGQVFINLIENASKYSPFNTEVTIAAEGQINGLYIAVLDSGPGIPSSQMEALFKPYFTINKPDNVQSGIGLGLSVVKAIIEAHGGQVGVENIPKGGAKVWFTLPFRSKETTG